MAAAARFNLPPRGSLDMSDPAPAAQRTPRICACVLMNHPFPAILPLLRRIYRDRFSEVRFLVPFARLPDEDVITVYRGSYTHAAYLTDAHAALAALDCDYYIVLHDDVLLNPKITEANFLELFPLGPAEGFIPHIGSVPEHMGDWAWYYGFLPKLLYPKSLLFGSGVERANLVKYLPPVDQMREALERAGVPVYSDCQLDPARMEGVLNQPSRVLLHGLAGGLPVGTEAQTNIDARSVDIEQQFMRLIVEDQHMFAGRAGDPGHRVELPIPLIGAGYSTDFYIVPKPAFDDYCHHIGVASAANLFVEILAPTLLFACCERVRTGVDFGLDFSGFDEPKAVEWFADARCAAIHPFKLSVLATEKIQDAFIELLRRVATDAPIDPALLVRLGFRTSLTGNMPGWHPGESWGVWASEHEALIQLELSAPAPVRLRLRAPLHPKQPVMTGRLVFNEGTAEVGFSLDYPDNGQIDVEIDELVPDADHIGRIRLISDVLVQPSTLEAGSADTRLLGVGLMNVEAMPQ